MAVLPILKYPDPRLNRVAKPVREVDDRIRQLVRDMAGRPIDDAIAEDTAGRIARVRASDEAQEGIASFFEKRRPAWVQAGSAS